jgi:protoporphyrinogen oxidase
MILIIGAGLAGLSTAYHLGKSRDYQICEKEKQSGGLCRSYTINGFTFDYTGHLLHTRQDYTRRLLDMLLPGKLSVHRRQASIYTQGVLTPYPFQANLYKLPREVIKECLVGFCRAREDRAAAAMTGQNATNNDGAVSFKQWIVSVFGEGIARYFMVPYNEKLWRTDLNRISSDWVDWSIPVPTLEEVVGGALGITNERMGYSAQFLYPRAGGIGILPKSFLPHVTDVLYHKQMTSVDLKEKRVWFSDGDSRAYTALVSTVPLPELLGMIRHLPGDLSEMSRGLRHISVLDINLGISRNGITDQHWIYFPESAASFYRAGCYSNFAGSSAPSAAASLYLEISYLPGTDYNQRDMIDDALRSLRQCGLLKGSDQILVESVVDIPYAYVIYDDFRKKNLPSIMDFLKSNGIWSIGRYGSWSYMSMEDAILEGKATAEDVCG